MFYKPFGIIPFLLFCVMQAGAQLIYERTYPENYISLENPFELSDGSTVSFTNSTLCGFAGWIEISPTGEMVRKGALANESTHSLHVRQTGPDSILISCRVGPLDYPGSNFFQISLWTPDGLQTIVMDSVEHSYWEDLEGSDPPYSSDIYLLVHHQVVYRRYDTLYTRDYLNQHISYTKSFTEIYEVIPVDNGLMVYSLGSPPVYLNWMLDTVSVWTQWTAPPVSYTPLVAIDSFLVSVNTSFPGTLQLVNVYNEDTTSIDLSDYFTRINSVDVRGDLLLLSGVSGSAPYAILMDRYFNVIHQTSYALPEPLGNWQLSFFPERIYALTSAGMGGYGADYRVAYAYLDPNPIRYVDLELLDVSVDSFYQYSPSTGSPFILVLAATVVNHSPDTLNRMTIHYLDSPVGWCDDGIYKYHFSNLNVLPGDTTIVHLNAIHWEAHLHKPFIRKFYVQYGNFHLDSLPENNSFQLSYLISKAEDPTVGVSIVYPNPFSDYLRLLDASPTAQLILFDQMGRRVASGYQQLESLDRLPSGVYFLQVENGSARTITRVVKSE